jgi:molybdate transport system permease protein
MRSSTSPRPPLAVFLPGFVLLMLMIVPPAALALRAANAPIGALELLDRPMLMAVTLSLTTTAISTVIILGLGTPLAYILARYRFPFRELFGLIIELPVVLPPVVAGLGLLMAFGRSSPLGAVLYRHGLGLPFTSAAVVLAQVFVAAPFFVRTAQVRFAAIPIQLEEAATSIGAGQWAFFWHIAIPISRPGMQAGLLLSWARALGEFGATLMFAGNLQGRTQTMPLLMYGAFERDLNLALWTGLVLAAIAMCALAVGRLLVKDASLPTTPLA